ncbi:MAG: UDP-N-acetylglucosamine 2-epimerase (non-hydrolyzing) [Acetobacteraceae bacterium]|nr:UDP-N-acetylglucosamine 2-epimerase (non-hydrolyzing) [Acetobacteraceae bacterium]
MNRVTHDANLRILCVVGTRPEVIKMAPVIHELRRRSWAHVSVLCTAQHRDLTGPLLHLFGIEPEHDLNVMTQGQNLHELTARLMTGLPSVFDRTAPGIVLAQGDTTTVMATALACFYSGIAFGHVEAGLRTGDMRDPFPEEFNRVVASRIATLNFAPTVRAETNLLREGVDPDSIHVTGNTGIDALHWVVARETPLPVPISPGQRVLLVTLHRRENIGVPMQRLFVAIRRLVQRNRDLLVIYPLHPNPRVSGPAHEALDGLPRVVLCPAFTYPEFVAVLRRAYLVLTDSGGIQEEAPTFGKPVLVARETTERPEAIEAGVARIAGTDSDRVAAAAQTLLDDPAAYAAMVRPISPFGDGKASGRIGDALAAFAANVTGATTVTHHRARQLAMG